MKCVKKPSNYDERTKRITVRTNRITLGLTNRITLTNVFRNEINLNFRNLSASYFLLNYRTKYCNYYVRQYTMSSILYPLYHDNNKKCYSKPGVLCTSNIIIIIII